MTTVVLSPIGNGQQFFGGATSNSNPNIPLAGGLLAVYLAGTGTPATTYTDVTGTVPNSNPIVLNADGRPPYEIWWVSGFAYKIVLLDAASNVIRTYDNLFGINDAAGSFLVQNNRNTFTATASQTVFNLTFTYVTGVNMVNVYINGSKQTTGIDYNETSGTSITLTTGATVGDTVDILSGTQSAFGAIQATNVGYTPPGGVATTVSAALIGLMGETYTAINNAAGVTITAAQIVGGIISHTGAVAVADTFDTATNIIAALPTIAPNTARWVKIINLNSGILTINGNASVTVVGTNTIPVGASVIGVLSIDNVSVPACHLFL
jgi:hypothetical protein